MKIYFYSKIYFDSVPHDILHDMKLIEKFPFNPYIIEWINIFLDSLRRKRFHMF